MSVVLQNGPQVRLRVVAALPGERGIPGPPATILGTLPSVDDLPPTGERGDIYTIDGDGWAWDGMQWVNAGRFQGEQGIQGIQGEVGPPPVLTSGTVDTLAPGSSATAAVVPLPAPGEYQIDFGIPSGLQGVQGIQGIQGEVGPPPVMLAGAVTTLAPGSSATSAVTPTANPGEYELTLGIPQGAKGDKGDSFDVDAVGPFSDRSLYDGEPAGFSFLDTDASLLYIRLGASGWSDAIPFGKGDPGPQGETGPAGPGIAVGGTVGQSLIKAGAADYDTAWATLTKGDVGLGDVDNTSDMNKPVSTAQQSALNLKAPLASPALTGTPTVPTATAGTNTTQAASTAFVASSVSTKADIASPTFTGVPAAPTAAATANTTQLATTAYVKASQYTKNVNIMLSSGNYTVPAGVYAIDVELWGGGGGGGWSSVMNKMASGGGGGGYCRAMLGVAPGQVFSAVVGAGGGLGNGGSGGDGGTTTFGVLAATGGKGGGTDSVGFGGAGGVGSGGAVGLNGQYGGTAPSTSDHNVGGAGGASPRGGSGGNQTVFSGSPGNVPGGGGSGCGGYSASIGGAGAQGMIVITY